MSSDSPNSTAESEMVWDHFHRRKNGFFVDVGANDPKKGSQSWFLEQQGWRGLLVEPQPDLCARLRAERPASQTFQLACGAPGHAAEMEFHIASMPSKSSLEKNRVAAETTYIRTELVKIFTLDELLEKAGNPAIDFVSIDVEGTQLDVLRGFSLERHRPALLLIEDHLRNLSVHRHLKANGYRLIRRTGLNDWYVPKEQMCKTPLLTRVRLFKKLWLNTPFRKFAYAAARARPN